MSRLISPTVIAITLLLIAAFSNGCEQGSSQTSSTNLTQVEGDVRSLLNRWTDAFEARDLDRVRSVLTTSPQFVWLEDGEPRYRSVDEIVKALASFPPGLKFTHTLGDVKIVPMSNDAAWAEVATTTQIEQGGRVVSEFTSLVLMILQRDEVAWRIHAAHTSTSKPRSATPR